MLKMILEGITFLIFNFIMFLIFYGIDFNNTFFY